MKEENRVAPIATPIEPHEEFLVDVDGKLQTAEHEHKLNERDHVSVEVTPRVVHW